MVRCHMSSVSPIAMARLAAMKKPEQPAGTSTWTYDARAMIEANDTDLRALGISTGKVKSMPDGGQLWELTGCPYSQDHDDGAFRVQYADGGIHVGCHHARCQGKTIKVEPTLFRRTLEVTGTPGISTTPLQGGNGQHAAGGSPRSEAETPERMPWVVSLADVEAKPIEWI